MAFTTGTAANYHDLLDRLRRYLTADDAVHSNEYTGTGDGTLSSLLLGASAVSETWTIECTAEAADGGTFSVVGSVSGAQADATVGVAYDNGFIEFTIVDGAVDFDVGDKWVLEVLVSDVDVPWTELDWTPPATITDEATLYIRGPGADVDKQVFLQFQSVNRPADNSYGWKVRGAVGYDPGGGWTGQPGVSPDVWFNTWPNPMTYWFYVNDRRIMVIAKIGIVYVSMYAGFFLPFALPSEYPFPLYIAGSANQLQEYNWSNAVSRFFVDPGNGCAYYRHRTNGSWRPVINHYSSTALDNVSNDNGCTMWPYRSGRANADDVQTNWEYTAFQNLRANLNGEMPMFTPHIIDTYYRTFVGGLDGVYVTGGNNRVPEQTITFDGRDFRLFPNLFRSRPKDFMAIEEI